MLGMACCLLYFQTFRLFSFYFKFLSMLHVKTMKWAKGGSLLCSCLQCLNTSAMRRDGYISCHSFLWTVLIWYYIFLWSSFLIEFRIKQAQLKGLTCPSCGIPLQIIWSRLTPSLPREITLICQENILKNWVVHYNYSSIHTLSHSGDILHACW